MLSLTLYFMWPKFKILSLSLKSRWGFNVSDVSLLCFRALNSSAEAGARRRISLDKQGPTVVHQKPGPLQTIFELPPDEVGNYYNFTHSCMYLIPMVPTCKSCCFLLIPFRLLTTVIHVHLRGHFCIMDACMSLHGIFAFIQTSFQSKSRLAHINFSIVILWLNMFTIDPLFGAYLFMSLW